MTRVRAIFATAAALVCLAGMSAQAQPWPSRPVRIIAPFAAGGAADTLGRIIAEQLSTAFRQQFFIENRGGAGGIIGAQAGAAAEPDGYTKVPVALEAVLARDQGRPWFTHLAVRGGGFGRFSGRFEFSAGEPPPFCLPTAGRPVPPSRLIV